MKSNELLDRAAMNKYHHHYNNATYSAAIAGKSNSYANQLIDEALAICGSPFYKISNQDWSEEATKFLNLFI